MVYTGKGHYSKKGIKQGLHVYRDVLVSSCCHLAGVSDKNVRMPVNTYICSSVTWLSQWSIYEDASSDKDNNPIAKMKTNSRSEKPVCVCNYTAHF